MKTSGKADITQYIRNSQKVGDFWGLYLIGFPNIKDLKWTFTNLILSICCSSLISYSMNWITVHKTIPYAMVQTAMFIYGITLVECVMSYMLEKVCLAERNTIHNKITNYVFSLYTNASVAWHTKNSVTQQSSLDTVFNVYTGVTYRLISTVESTIRTLTMCFIAMSNELSITVAIVFGSMLLYKIEQWSNASLNEYDKQVSKRQADASLDLSNQYTLRNDVMYNPTITSITPHDKYNPIVGLNNQNSIWAERDNLATKTNSRITAVKTLMLVGLCMYLGYVGKSELIFFVLLNDSSLFGIVSTLNNFTTMKNLMSGRMATTFTLLSEIIEEHDKLTQIVVRRDEPERFEEKISLLHEYKNTPVLGDIDCITVHNIYMKITDKLLLDFRGTLTIPLNNQGIILLNGNKGSGKSVTMDILAGYYDGTVTGGFYIGNDRIHGEFRAIKDLRFYIRQGISDGYRRNKQDTVTYTLSDLFPYGAYDDIKKFLSNFNVAHKMPADMKTRFSDSSRGLSPGELQIVVCASQLWRYSKSNCRLLLLDEPERNIDFETVKIMFDTILKIAKGSIVLITHSEELKLLLKDKIVQKWNYAPNITGTGALQFTVQEVK